MKKSNTHSYGVSAVNEITVVNKSYRIMEVILYNESKTFERRVGFPAFGNDLPRLQGRVNTHVVTRVMRLSVRMDVRDSESQ